MRSSHFFSLEAARLEFTADALHLIAKRAMERGTGARALRSVIDQFMIDVMYDLPDRDNQDSVYLIDAAGIERGLALDDMLRKPRAAKESA